MAEQSTNFGGRTEKTHSQSVLRQWKIKMVHLSFGAVAFMVILTGYCSGKACFCLCCMRTIILFFLIEFSHWLPSWSSMLLLIHKLGDQSPVTFACNLLPIALKDRGQARHTQTSGIMRNSAVENESKKFEQYSSYSSFLELQIIFSGICSGKWKSWGKGRADSWGEDRDGNWGGTMNGIGVLSTRYDCRSDEFERVRHR